MLFGFLHRVGNPVLISGLKNKLSPSGNPVLISGFKDILALSGISV